MDDYSKAEKQFEEQVPYDNEALLILKAHLVLEVRLLEFIRSRISSELYDKIARPREGAYQVRLLVARALAERDEIAIETNDILWNSLEKIGKIRNDIAHILEHKGTSLQDKMQNFVKIVDPTGELTTNNITPKNLNITFWWAANYINSLLAAHCDPLSIDDESS